MCKKLSRGFTLGELTIVAASMIVLVGIIMIRVQRAKMISSDDALVAGMNAVQLALEEYRSLCRSYPAELDPSDDRGYRQICAHTLGEFLPADVDLGPYTYEAFSHNSSTSCAYYWISVQLSGNSSLLDEDTDWDPGSLDSCGATSITGDDADFMYDLHGPIGTPNF